MPWIVRLPGAQSAGRRVKDPVQHIDLLPTLAALAGLAVPPGLRGRDLSVALFGRGRRRAPGHLRRSPVSALSLRLERAAVADRRSLPLHQGPARGTVRPRTRSRRAHEHRRSSAGRRRLRSGPRSTRSWRAGTSTRRPSVSDEDRQRLAALGYVGTQSSSAGQSRRARAPIRRTKRRSFAPIGRQSSSSATAVWRRARACSARSWTTIRR